MNATLFWRKINTELPEKAEETYLVIDKVGDIYLAYYTEDESESEVPVWISYEKHCLGDFEEIEDVMLWASISMPPELFKLIDEVEKNK